jgi:acyl-CoA synthetase (AMP-forming)/AMP-acid ligase II
MDSMIARLVGPGSPFELVDSIVGGNRCKTFVHGPKSLREIYARAAQRTDATAIVLGDSRFTYAQLFGAARSLARRIEADICFGPSCRVGIVVRNPPDWLIAFIAVTSMGATAVVPDPDAAASQIAECLARTTCRSVIADADVAASLRVLGEQWPIVFVDRRVLPGTEPDWCVDKGQPPRSGFPGPSTGARRAAAGANGGTPEALVAFTSGTRSRPKGVVLDERGILTGISNMLLGAAMASVRDRQRRSRPKKPPDRAPPASLLLSPLFHIGGYSHFLLMCVLGGKIVFLPRWDTADALRVIRTERVRSLAGASPPVVRAIMRSRTSAADCQSLESLILHGSALQANLLAEISSRLPDVAIGTGYGMTETNGSICVAAGAEVMERPTASGAILPSADIRIVDGNGSEAPCGERGDIWIRGAMLMRGYCDDTERDGRDLHHGWLQTGDSGAIDKEGVLHVFDRCGDSVPVEGGRMACGEIERAISTCPLIDEGVALALSDEYGTEQCVLAIVPRADEHFDEATVRHGVEAAIPQLGRARIVLRAELPRGHTGKIDRRALVQLLKKE